jgi:hypothetical protein
MFKKLDTVACHPFDVLQQHAANGSLTMYDDTTGRILENQAKGIPTHTTAFMSVHEGHTIHLFLQVQIMQEKMRMLFLRKEPAKSLLLP